MKTPLNATTLRSHLTYNWWKYVLVVILAWFGVDLLYTVTAYRTPPELKVDFYVYGYTNETAMDEYMESVRVNEMADMEEMNCLTIVTDQTYGPMQLMTYVAAGEGSLYLLPREQFLSMAAQQGLLPMEDDEELMAIFNEAGISLQSGWRTVTETGETHLFGIPQDKLPGLTQMAYAQDGYVVLNVTSRNEENARKFLRILCRDMITAKE